MPGNTMQMKLHTRTLTRPAPLAKMNAGVCKNTKRCFAVLPRRVRHVL